MKFYKLMYRTCKAFLFITWVLISNCAIQTQNKARINTNAPVVESTRSNQEVPEYRLGYGDVIHIKFFNNRNFNEEVIIRPDGRISMEKVGDIFVTGMTPKQLSEQITKIYSNIINNPEVTVIVRQFGGYLVYVLGEVNSPGGYPVQRDMNFLQALAAAGGPKNTANLRSVIILRRHINGELEAQKLDLNNPAKLKCDFDQNDLIVQRSDVIYVPKTFISNINTFLKQVYDGALPPLDIYLRALWWTYR